MDSGPRRRWVDKLAVEAEPGLTPAQLMVRNDYSQTSRPREIPDWDVETLESSADFHPAYQP